MQQRSWLVRLGPLAWYVVILAVLWGYSGDDRTGQTILLTAALFLPVGFIIGRSFS